MSDSEKEKGFLRRHFEFAGTFALHPIKTVKNIAAAIAEKPHTAEKILFGASTAFGAAALGIGAVSLDPLLSGIGLTFLTIGGNRLNTLGDVIRTERHGGAKAESAATAAVEPEEEKVDVVEPEKTNSERLAAVLGKNDDDRPKGFKPDLSRFKKPDGPVSGLTGGP